MFKSKSFLVFSAIIIFSLPAWGQGPGDSKQLTSTSSSNVFYEIAYELANSPEITAAEAEQAIIFLTAAMNLDSSSKQVIPVFIKLVSQYSERDNSKLVYQLLTNYVDKSADADLEPARVAIRYLLKQLNSREEREILLEGMLKNMAGKNAFLDSELATSLGMLMAETTDSNSAQKYLIQAYYNNKYNKQAFAQLAELMTEQISPAMYLEYLRLRLDQNPIDLEAALGFAQYAEQLQLYETAVGAYEYCEELFGFLYPLQPLPASIYLPWAISCYNTQRNQHKCLQIAERLRQDDQFDLLLEAIAAKAAVKTGNPDIAKRIFQAAEEKAHLHLVNSKDNHNTKTIKYEQLAWFYCFATPDPNKAVDWANKAYSIGPNSATAAALLAYSLVMNGETEWAKLLTSNYERNQIADLTLAQIQLAEGQKETAIQTLKSAITKDPGSLAAERAKEILTEQGGDYIPPVDPGTTLGVLKNSFGETVVPTFTRPDKIISFELNLRGMFSYGSELDGTVAIRNNSSQPLVISDEGLFKGYIRIDANINGDLKHKIQGLVSVKITPGVPIKPGRSIVVPVRLLTGELRQMLLTYPQASLDIEFNVHLDPLMIADGKLTNRLPGIKPSKVLVKRPGIELTKKSLQNRLDSLTKGRQGQKIKTVQLFTGLLKEQHAIAGSKPLYKMTTAEWMPALLQSALIHNLIRGDDWVTKVHTMAGMLSLPLEYELTSAVGENLSEKHWPARMMSLYLLAKYQKSDFSKVLDWTAKYDSNKFVRDMAIALGAALPEKITAEPAK
jgi:hypothetical protein